MYILLEQSTVFVESVCYKYYWLSRKMNTNMVRDLFGKICVRIWVAMTKNYNMLVKMELALKKSTAIKERSLFTPNVMQLFYLTY